MKVGIVIPPRQKGAKLPLDALYISSILTKAHIETKVMDLTHCQGVIQKDWFRNDCNTFWVVSNSNYNRAMQVKGFIPATCTTIISGTDPTMMPEILVKSGWDFVLTGEPELAANGVVSNIFRRGIIHCQTPHMLDDLPFPARHTIKMVDYYGKIGPDSVAEVIASRSAGVKPRARGVDNVIDEIKELNKSHRFTRFKITDHMFFSRHELLISFCNRLVPLKLSFDIEIPVDLLNFDTMPSLLKLAGVKKINLLASNDNRDYSKLVGKLKEEGIELYGPGSTTNPDA